MIRIAVARTWKTMENPWYMLWSIWCTVLMVAADRIFDCPSTWVTYGQSCYQFNFYQARVFEDAAISCEVDGATLVTINSTDEHKFIQQWLKRYDALRNTWFTSGNESAETNGHIIWKDGSKFTGDDSFWLNGKHDDVGGHIVYVYDGEEYRWSHREVTLASAYICEIQKVEAFRIMMEARDFDYGSPFSDPNEIEKGPQIVVQPNNVVIIPGETRIFLKCVANGNPRPTYKWYRGTNNELVNSETDSRYTLTNGKLTISQPQDALDADKYQCEATNKLGSVLSRKVQLSFGVLGEFPSDDIIPQVVRGEIGAVFKCPNVHYKPSVVYRWFKNSPQNFVKTDRYPHAFVSRNGRLYFSELTSSDAGLYYCLARLNADIGAHLSSEQSPIVTSMPTPVVVKNNAAAKRDPVIHNDFIAIFPEPTLLGQTVSMECMAFGSQPLIYYWTRKDKPLPDRSKLKGHNRILEITNVTMDDIGTYVCHVKRGQFSSAVSKSVYLKVEAKPFFVYPLKSRHMDVGSRLIWRCMVLAVPNAEFSWYKNSKLLRSGHDGIEINGNVLKIRSLDDSLHRGMYQCVASNVHGSSYSAAQLRILSFKPTFTKYPVTTEQFASLGGSIILFCQPEAAPYPTFNWTKDGRLITPEVNQRSTILPNGNLLLKDVQHGDAGVYTCLAKNHLGEASSSGEVKVVKHSLISRGPQNTKVLINETAFLYCHGSVSKSMDHVFKWFFNDKLIDIIRDQHYLKGTSNQQLGLYIRSAQLRHTGRYKCVLQTPVDSSEAEAMLTVLGPPSRPAGVFAKPVRNDDRAYRIYWTDGNDNGSPIRFYTILVATKHRSDFQILRRDIPTESTSNDNNGQRTFTVGDLRPGLLYGFKIRAKNIRGIGPASEASAFYSVAEAPPKKVPEHVGGGGGSVGTLKITWTALPIEDQGGEGIGYNIYWRESFKVPWKFKKIKGDKNEFNTLVGKDKFYTQYEIKVQAFNKHGAGPNSSIVQIFSAEDLPVLAPNGVSGYGYNESAIMVKWKPMEENRETIRGKILGYILTFWNRWQANPVITGVSYPGQRSSGLVTGLAFYDSDHYIYVQVYNSAGVGPPSGQITVTTKGEAPLLFPKIIQVFSHGPTSIRLTWRGIPTGNTEEALKGYKILYWTMKESFHGARVVTVDRSANQGVIGGLEKGVLYKARVRGYSNGGDGKLSAMVYFTLGGQVSVDLTNVGLIASSQRPESFYLLLLLALCFSCSIK